MKLSIVIPCYNEERTLAEIVAQVLATDIKGMDREVIIVDDCSGDGVPQIAAALAADHPEVKVLTHPENRGKSAALKTGFESASGDIILVQDADLEYDPADYAALLVPFIENGADVVYGSRFLAPDRTTFLGFTHFHGNRALTMLSNVMNGLRLTDLSTCYKVFRRSVLDQMTLEEEKFGFCPEFTAKAARLKPKPEFIEIPVAYTSRSYAEGKKISWRHGLRAIYCIIRYSLFR
ncbi:MAG: glycosyltransferase family 2 protein [Rhodospirillaceae bacterium]|nr:glycosyltransferase family 2 protein [Rhodospirillaceae bacterium]